MRQTLGKLIKQRGHDVYRNEFRQPYKLGEHRGVKSRPVAFLATNAEVGKNLPEPTEKDQFSFDSSSMISYSFKPTPSLYGINGGQLATDSPLLLVKIKHLNKITTAHI